MLLVNVSTKLDFTITLSLGEINKIQDTLFNIIHCKYYTGIFDLPGLQMKELNHILEKSKIFVYVKMQNKITKAVT